MKIEESVPNITPSNIANEKLRVLSPPKQKIQSSTMSVENDVLIVRARVSFSDLLKSSCRSIFLWSVRFSRIRSNTTTLSLIE